MSSSPSLQGALRIKSTTIHRPVHHLTDLQDFESSGHDLRHVVLQTVHDGVFQEGFVQTLLLPRKTGP